MTADTITEFKKELNSFFVLILLNMVIGAMVMAFGMQSVVSSVLALSGQSLAIVQVLTTAFSLVCFGLGLMWVLSSARILKGITGIRREYRNHAGPVPSDILTGWIVRLMAHYRENQKRIGLMIIICAFGGFAFLILGILNVVQGIGATDALIRVFSLIAAAINLAIGTLSLKFCRYFQNYSAVWDERLKESDRSGNTLQHALEQR